MDSFFCPIGVRIRGVPLYVWRILLYVSWENSVEKTEVAGAAEGEKRRQGNGESCRGTKTGCPVDYCSRQCRNQSCPSRKHL